MGVSERPAWRFLRRDQVVFYGLCLLLVAAAALRSGISQRRGGTGVRRLQAGERIDYRVSLNGADEAELDLLPGIGPAKARRIVEFRQTHGPFQRIDDLARVPGISRACVDKLRDLVTVDTPSPGGEPPQ